MGAWPAMICVEKVQSPVLPPVGAQPKAMLSFIDSVPLPTLAPLSQPGNPQGPFG